jgi:cardiolipin synthase
VPLARIRSLPTSLKVVATIVAILGIALLFAQDQETLRLESPMGATDPRFARYAAALTASPLTSGDRFEVLVNGVQIVPAQLEAIRRARERISFETYYFDAGRMAAEFTAALADASRRGVRVQMIVDAVGAQTMDQAHVDNLIDAGVDLATYNPLHWYSIEEANYRTHRKILVVDGEVGFTGGAGIGDQWYGNAQDADHWRETHLRVVGPAVTQLEAAFYENWAESGRPASPALNLEPPSGSTDAETIVARSSPAGGTNAVKLLYLLSVAASRRTLDIASPYFMLDESTRHAILGAASRGVRVRVLVEGELTDAMPVKFASRRDYDGLLEAGIELYEFRPTMMHVKTVMVDGAWSILGSTNFSNRSFELNDEINVAVASRDVAARLAEDFESDLKRADRLTLEEWRRRPFLHKARERFWGLFGELF